MSSLLKQYPKYSVLMTVYKSDNPEYFALSLDSIINQSLSPDEIVLVKDGPISAALQRVIDERLDSNITIKQIQLSINRGLGLALNAGIPECRNELIARMDSDDYSLPERCKKQVEAFIDDESLGIVGYPVDEFIGNIDNIVGCRNVPYTNEDIYTFAKKRDPFNHPTVMYKKSKVIEVGMYSDYRKNQDTDLWIKMLQNNAKCKNLKEHLFRFRFDENTFQKRKNWLNTRILLEIRYKAWRNGFNSFSDFMFVSCSQLAIWLMPIGFQKFLYKHVLRR